MRFLIHIPNARMTFLIGRVLGSRIKAAEASRTRCLIYSNIADAEAGITHTEDPENPNGASCARTL